MSAYGHVCIYACCLQPSICHSCAPAPPPHPRKRNDIHTHFLFEGSGQALSPGSPETSGMWDKTRLQQATSLKDWLVCQSAESSFVLCDFVRQRWQLTFVRQISCPVLGKGLDKVHRGALTPLLRLPISPPPSPHHSLPFFFPPLESPLVIFPTHWPIILPYVSMRSDLIGCVGGVWKVRVVFISHCVLLDSLQQRPLCAHTDSRRRKVARGERGRQIDEKERIPLYVTFTVMWFLAWEIVNVSCLVLL